MINNEHKEQTLKRQENVAGIGIGRVDASALHVCLKHCPINFVSLRGACYEIDRQKSTDSESY